MPGLIAETQLDRSPSVYKFSENFAHLPTVFLVENFSKYNLSKSFKTNKNETVFMSTMNFVEMMLKKIFVPIIENENDVLSNTDDNILKKRFFF